MFAYRVRASRRLHHWRAQGLVAGLRRHDTLGRAFAGAAAALDALALVDHRLHYRSEAI